MQIIHFEYIPLPLIHCITETHFLIGLVFFSNYHNIADFHDYIILYAVFYDYGLPSLE